MVKKRRGRLNPRKNIKFYGILFLIVGSVIALGSGAFFNVYTYDRNIFSYGTAQYKLVNSNGVVTTLSSGGTLDADTYKLRIIFTWTSTNVKPDYYVGYKLAGQDRTLTRGEFSFTLSGNTWTSEDISFKNFPTGTTDTMCIFFNFVRSPDFGVDVTYGGYSPYFKVVNSQQILPPPVWINPPVDKMDAVIGFSYALSWGFYYEDACDLTITSDGEILATQHFDYNWLYSYFNQAFFYVYKPEIATTKTFTCTLHPSANLLPNGDITDSMIVKSLTEEDFETTITGLPEGLEQIGVVMSGQVPYVSFETPVGRVGAQSYSWLVNQTPPVEVASTSWGGGLEITAILQLGPDFSYDVLGDSKVVFFQKGTDNRYEFPMILKTAAEEPNIWDNIRTIILPIWSVVLQLDSWKEVTINLDVLPAGEYTVQIRSENALGFLYILDEWDMSINSLPVGFIATYGAIIIGIIVVISLIAFGTLWVKRQIFGYTHYQGRYR